MAEEKVILTKVTTLDVNGNPTMYRAHVWRKETVGFQGDKTVYTISRCDDIELNRCSVKQRMEWNTLSGAATTIEVLKNLAKMDS